MATAGHSGRSTNGHTHMRRRADKQVGFYIHLAVYLLVNIGLATLNITKNPHHLWFYWVAIGWGIGVVAHAFGVFMAPRDTNLQNPTSPTNPM